MEFSKKHNKLKYLYSWPVIVLLFVVVVLLSLSIFKRFTIEREMYNRRNNAEKELQELYEKREVIQKKVDYLESKRGVEEEIRKDFDVAKEGEQVIVLTGEDPERNEEIFNEEELIPWYIFWR